MLAMTRLNNFEAVMSEKKRERQQIQDKTNPEQCYSILEIVINLCVYIYCVFNKNTK